VASRYARLRALPLQHRHDHLPLMIVSARAFGEKHIAPTLPRWKEYEFTWLFSPLVTPRETSVKIRLSKHLPCLYRRHFATSLPPWKNSAAEGWSSLWTVKT